MNTTSQPEAALPKNPAELALELYNILLPHASEVRQRAIQSAMTSLGESPIAQRDTVRSSIGEVAEEAGDFGDVKLGAKALKWAQKHGITRAMLDEVFHLTDGGFGVIANSVPGASKREMTVNCYLLSGLRGLLMDDAPSLNEGETIAVCKRLTAYDKNNHTANRQAVGNRMAGNRPTFTLTGPGETAAAELVKQMTRTRNS